MKTVAILEDAIKLCGEDDFEQRHAVQVAKLSLKLFDKLQSLHRMGNSERIWLRVASLLHDVGKSVGGGHHKASRDIIIKDANLPFRKRVRKIIGLIARYHKGATPKDTQKYYSRMNEGDKRCVRMLAGILRLADGLDAGHKEMVTDLACEVRGGRVIVYLVGDDGIDFHKAAKKADLLELAFGVEAEIKAAASDKVHVINLDSGRIKTYAHAA